MEAKSRLQLTWIGKEQRPRLEPRVLLPDESKSYHAARRVSENDNFDNRLVFGDNLLALKALEQDLAGKVKCVYIDPPFNTQQAMKYYDDGREHSIWLSLIRDRLQLIHRLMARDGTLCVHIDDNELGYLIVLLDEIFGRANRIHIITFKQGAATGHKAINPGCVTTTNFVAIYASDRASWRPNRVFTGRERDKRYSQFIENRDEPYETWNFVTLMKALAGSLRISVAEARKAIKAQPDLLDEFVLKNAASVVRTAQPDYAAVSESARSLIDASRRMPRAVLRLEREDHADMYFKNGDRILFYSDKLKYVDGAYVSGEPLTTLWDDVLSNNLHNEGGVDFPKGKKPEGLIKRILDLATNPGDLVLDSFAGSGTTGAVAHKMGRRWIMIEQGEHCHTHIIPRLKKVIDGQDPGGVTEATGWKGGGGFRYFRVAPSLMEQDRFGNWVISGKVGPAMLAEAVCKLEGFRYEPSDSVWWQHGRSTENDFLYVTRQTLAREDLQRLSDEVGPQRTLLVMCGAFRCRELSAFPNLTVKKIPAAVLDRCEWGKDDYSLAVAALPPPEPASEAPAAPQASKPGSPRRKDKGAGTGSLFTPKGDA